MLNTIRSAVLALATLAAAQAAGAAGLLPQVVGDRLRAGELTQLQDDLTAQLKATPDDAQARFALGSTQFLAAVEHLAQGFHRYGLAPPRGIQRVMPLFRLPVPVNPHPEHLTYEAMRGVLKRFSADLAMAEATLAMTGPGDVKLPVAIGLARLDLNGDGKASPEESLWQVYNQTLAGGTLTQDGAERFVIVLDRGDVPWLRGYTHLLTALSEFLLAHDWQLDFDTTFHMYFPEAGLPGAAVERYRRPHEMSGFDDGAIADFIAFIHLMHWPVKEPERMAAVLGHLEKVVVLSRESWKLILAETDNEGEWIPNPAQTSVAIPGAAVSKEQVEAWMVFLGEFDALLAGKKLLPHWRLDKGVNLRRVFTEPTAFDPVLWAQGSAALPYLEDGPMTAGSTWNGINRVFMGNFLGYAAWFN